MMTGDLFEKMLALTFGLCVNPNRREESTTSPRPSPPQAAERVKIRAGQELSAGTIKPEFYSATSLLIVFQLRVVTFLPHSFSITAMLSTVRPPLASQSTLITSDLVALRIRKSFSGAS